MKIQLNYERDCGILSKIKIGVMEVERNESFSDEL